MAKDSDETKAKLKKLAKDHQLEIPLTICVDKSTTGKFKLSDKVKNTILIYRRKKVEANFALNKITDQDIAKIVETAKKVATS